MSERDPGLLWAVSDLVCADGHVEVAPVTGDEFGECWYGHPVVSGAPIPPWATFRGALLEVW